MSQIEKGAPRAGKGPQQTELGALIRDLAEAAYADKGEWFSVENPADTPLGNIHSLINGTVARMTSERSTKNNRIWIRFYKDSDASE